MATPMQKRGALASLGGLFVGAVVVLGAHQLLPNRKANAPIFHALSCSAGHDLCDSVIKSGMKPRLVIVPAIRVHWMGEIYRMSWPRQLQGRSVTPRIEFQGQLSWVDTAALLKEISGLVSTEGALPQALFVDYRGSTDSLPSYAAFLERLRQRLPGGVQVMISVMPSWLDAKGVKDVQEQADELVLQLQNLGDPVKGLFAGADVVQLTRQLNARAHVPFYLGMPVQAEDVYRDGLGHLIGTSEYPPTDDLMPVGGRIKIRSFADPVESEALLKAIKEDRPSKLEGVIWQAEKDSTPDMNWSVATLQRMVLGRPLTKQLRLDVLQNPDATVGRYQLFLRNDGLFDTAMPEVISMPAGCDAFDGASGYFADVGHGSGGAVLRLRRLVLLPPGGSGIVGGMHCWKVPSLPSQPWQSPSTSN